MAKGDDKRVRNRIDEQQGLAQNNLTNIQAQAVPQTQMSQNNLQSATNQQMGDYNDIMNRYRNFQASPAGQNYNAQNVDYSRTPEMQAAMSGYQNFANTGGFSDADLGALRARGISPIQAVYQNSRNELDRQKSLQGGYSPNYTAALAKMSGQLGSNIADQTQRVNAGIAEMRQHGQLSGLQGLGGLATSDTGFAQQAKLANQQAGLGAAGLNRQYGGDAMNLGALNGMANLYSAQPGLVNSFANQVQNNFQNQLQGQGLQNQLGLGTMNAQQQAAMIPGTWENNMSRIGGIANIGSSVIGGLTGMGALGGAANPASAFGQGANFSRNLGSGLTFAGM